MTDDEIKERSTLGGEILFETVHSDWSKERSKIEDQLRAREDEADVANRRDMVLAENANAEVPYPPKKISALLRRRRKDVEGYSDRLYWSEMFGVGGVYNLSWRPAVDMEAVIKSMTAEAIHKRAFYEVGEVERLTRVARRRRFARFVLDLPKYALIGAALILGLFLLGLMADVLQYLHRAPTVVTARTALSRLWNWFFTDTGAMTVLLAGILAIAFMKVRARLKKIAGDL